MITELDAHRPADAVEAASLHRTRRLLARLADPFDRDSGPVHVTGSALIRDGAGRVLLHRHKRLGVWLQPGGHLDPGEEAADAARREAVEETGVDARHPADGPRLVHLDVHPGPGGHIHLDLRYGLSAPGGATPNPADGESPDVAWFTLAEAAVHGDASLLAALRRSRR